MKGVLLKDLDHRQKNQENLLNHLHEKEVLRIMKACLTIGY